MLYTIKNESLTVSIDNYGAELKAITCNGLSYLHDGDPRYWGRCAPILFPNVGAIKDSKTIINRKSYKLMKHGFLRDQDFEVVNKDDNHITLVFRDNDYSYAVYPFHFTIAITYLIFKTTLSSMIKVVCNDDLGLPFNIGL